MKSIVLFFESKNGKYIKNVIIGVGAAIVMMGALFKLQGWEGAGPMLTIGLCTEAFIFAFQGLLPPHKDYYWERYYPNLDENPEIEAYKKGGKKKVAAGTATAIPGSPSKALDKMLDDAQVETKSLERLRESFQKFGKTVDQIKDISEVAVATGAYTNSAKEAAQALNTLKGTYAGAAATMQSFNDASESSAQFHQQVQVLSKNLGSLNQIYEVELKDANNHLKAMNKFYSNLINASDAMASSAADAQSTKEQIAALSKNLQALNSIYGNMLSAMQGR